MEASQPHTEDLFDRIRAGIVHLITGGCRYWQGWWLNRTGRQIIFVCILFFIVTECRAVPASLIIGALLLDFVVMSIERWPLRMFVGLLIIDQIARVVLDHPL
jgi:hypothetical protein